MQERQKTKQRLEASIKAEEELKQQVTAQQKQLDDANLHCEALGKAREEAEEELQVRKDDSVLSVLLACRPLNKATKLPSFQCSSSLHSWYAA